jgi:RNA-binding protein Musashi
MQSDFCKLFIGGISWDTNEERVKEYFSSYGEVIETIIMKDRNTGRGRGFGFVVFADAAIAESVTKEKHNIDGRMVEAKKAVPRDDDITMNRNSSTIQNSPTQARSRKIFVGGLASTVTEKDFKSYFDQFGNIIDVVVMYDHNTQRPRGFGFITYDSEDAVDKVLLRTFHELNGKMVEVKRAVPKELTPSSSPSHSPSRSPLVGDYNINHYGLGRFNSSINSYNQGFLPTMVSRFNPLTIGRTGLNPPIGSGYGNGSNFEPELNPYMGGNSNRFGNLIGNNSYFSSSPRNVLGNNGFNYSTNPTNSNAYMDFGNGGGNTFSNNNTSNVSWNSSPVSHQGRGAISSPSMNLGYNLGRNNVSSGALALPHGVYDGPFADFNVSGSVYEDPAWRLGNLEREIQLKSSPGYVGGYGITKRLD